MSSSMRGIWVGSGFLFAVAACGPLPEHVEAFQSDNGAVLADYDAALRASAKRDLACDEVLTVSAVDVDVKSRYSGTATFGAVDGCGHRALYTKQCNDELSTRPSPDGDVNVTTTTCMPAFFGALELGKATDARLGDGGKN